jgi:hypothetical protein
MHLDCFECGATVEADDLADLGERFLAHGRTSHEWPYPDQGIRNYAEATQRLTGAPDGEGGNFRGPRSMYDERGFEPVRTRARDTVVRRPV